MPAQTLEEFKQRLAQTIFWCASRADPSRPEACLRTPKLHPHLLNKTRLDTVNEVVTSRELFGHPAIQNAQLPSDFGGGRLLVYFPDVDLCCGAAEQETEGFFDVHNTPPWDTWVSCWHEQDSTIDWGGDEYLIAWIPPAFVESVNNGVSVNPEQCIMWLSDTSLELAILLRAENLLF